LQFNEYLKKCREGCNITQEQLAHDLYVHNTDLFESIQMGTIGKWERGIAKPKVSKQSSIINYFQLRTGKSLPFLNDYPLEEIESLICKAGMNNLVGENKKYIYDFPSEMMSFDDITVSPIHSTEAMNSLIYNNMHIHMSTTHPYSQLSREQFMEWALHPSNLFLFCEHKGTSLGIMFVLRVKPEIYNKLMNFEMKKSDISSNDFASYDEMGSHILLSFFAMNTKASTLLFIRYYAHLITNQDNIKDVGGIGHLESGKKIASNMNLKFQNSFIADDGTKIMSYGHSISHVLSSEYLCKMFLSKQDCPEE